MDTPDLKLLFPSFDLKLAHVLHATLDVPQEAHNHLCEALIPAGATTWTQFINEIHEYGYIADLEYQIQTGYRSITGRNWYGHNQYTQDAFLVFCNVRNQYPGLAAIQNKATTTNPLAPFPWVTKAPLASRPSIQATPRLTKPALSQASSTIMTYVSQTAPARASSTTSVSLTSPANNTLFRLELGNALAKCYHINCNQNVGFSFLIDSKKIYSDWSGGGNIPTKPDKPKAPADTTAHGNSAQALILQKFVKMLMDELDKRFNALPAKMIAQEAFKHIKDQVSTKKAKGELYTMLTRKIANRNTVADKNSINLLGVGELGDLVVMTYCAEAFRKSPHDEMTIIWLEEEQETNIEATGVLMEEFQTFWEVQEEVGSIQAGVAYLVSNQRDVVSTFNTSVMKSKPPPPASGEAGPPEWARALSAQVTALQATVHAKKAGNGPRTTSGGPQPARTWKQWKFYCYQCVHHIKVTTHRGGNNKKDQLWMKWCSPINSNAYDKSQWGDCEDVSRVLMQSMAKTCKAALLINLHPLGSTLAQYRALDSAATDHFLPASYIGGNPQCTNQGIRIGCANGGTMVSVGTDLLDLPKLPIEARGCHKFREVDVPLVSVPKRCQHRCSVNFDQMRATITNPAGATVLIGPKDPSRKLYIVPLHQPTDPRGTLPPRVSLWALIGSPRVVLCTTAAAHNAYEIQLAKQLITYLHVAAGFPVQATSWTKAIDKGYYISWPELNKQQLTMIFLDLKDTMQKPHPPEPFLKHRSEVATALGIIKDILQPTKKVRQAPKPKVKKRPILFQLQNFIGGIIGKEFNDGKNMREPSFYRTHSEDYTLSEVQNLLKQKQRFTKRNHEELVRQEASMPMKPKMVPLTNIPTPKGVPILNLAAPYLACSGSIWDKELNKWAVYRDLVKRPAAEIRERWMRLVPCGKQAASLQYTVAYRPEKADPHSNMETIKLHWNSVVSTPGAKYCTGDISNMYLCLSLEDDPKYIQFKWDLIPMLEPLAYHGYVYAKIKKAWYGLKQLGKIAHDDLVAHLATKGYHNAPRTEGLFLHNQQDISFTLIVDDFGIKYTKQEDVDWEGKQYIGIHLKWDYVTRGAIASMDGYVEQTLKEFEYERSKQINKGPSMHLTLNYGQKVQYTPPVEDQTMLGTAEPGESHAAYLVSYGARSRAGVHHYLGDKEDKMFKEPILVLAKIIKNVMESAAVAKVASLFINAQEALPERQCLIELGHPQPLTPLKTDNMAAQGILTGTIKAEQGKFNIFWEPGNCNLSDYSTKYHPGVTTVRFDIFTCMSRGKALGPYKGVLRYFAQVCTTGYKETCH
eukprot:jgi/Psemu1/23703/gm1.23703_g